GILYPAEDGIRYRHVTGVQTCALPIYDPCATVMQYELQAIDRAVLEPGHQPRALPTIGRRDPASDQRVDQRRLTGLDPTGHRHQIGRASGRERATEPAAWQ